MTEAGIPGLTVLPDGVWTFDIYASVDGAAGTSTIIFYVLRRATSNLVNYASKTTIAFVEGGASRDTITDSANGFITAGFEVGQEIVVTGSVSNNGTYTIHDVSAGTITLIAANDLTNESSIHFRLPSFIVIKVGECKSSWALGFNGWFPSGDGNP